ncbi:MAG TPA: hypothetical protein VF759_02480 [Allosphingosinicella sp.]|jgi:hypothetical protein
MSDLRLEDFAGLVGERFEVRAGEDIVPIELQAAQRVRGQSVRDGDPFTLIWLGPLEPQLPQAIYEIRRGDDLYEIFIVPISRDEQGTLYEAVFN